MSKELKIQEVAISENAGLYSIIFDGENETEYRKFLNKFKDNSRLNNDFRDIMRVLDKIINFGALERYFRNEGKMKDRVKALSLDSKKLRLYCIRVNEKVLIIGNGGEKNSRTYQECEELNGYVMDLQKFDKVFRAVEEDGDISMDGPIIDGIKKKTFKI